MYFQCGLEKNTLRIKKLKKPTNLNKGQILVKILYSSICHTQLQEIEMKRGKDDYIPRVYEGVGIINKIYKNCKKFKVGDKVCLTWVKSGKTLSKGNIYRQ